MVAGKTADFLVTVQKIEGPPAGGQRALAKSLGIADGTVEGLRADIKKNLEREVKFRLLARNKKAAAMDALVSPRPSWICPTPRPGRTVAA